MGWGRGMEKVGVWVSSNDKRKERNLTNISPHFPIHLVSPTLNPWIVAKIQNSRVRATPNHPSKPVNPHPKNPTYPPAPLPSSTNLHQNFHLPRAQSQRGQCSSRRRSHIGSSKQKE